MSFESVFKYELLDWIDQKKLGGSLLSSNPNAIQFLEENPEMINWNELSRNRNAIHLLEKNPTRINHRKLS